MVSRIRLLAAAVLMLLFSCELFGDVGLARHKRIFVVPPPGDLKIDGKLDDWDLSGQVFMYVTSETSEMQSARFAMMFDDQALYLSAVIRDPSPMMNRHDPNVDAGNAWDADSCQFRIVLDPAQGYPVNQGSFNAVPNDQMAHTLLWYYTDRKEPNLQLAYGMTYSPPKAGYKMGVVPRDKFQAAYLLADDRMGYTFEYRIPWATLEAKRAPKAGELVAATVQFNFSAPDGLKTAGGSGWAYDVMSGPGFTFQSSACWGKAIFSEKGNLPKELTEEGVSVSPPLPLTFTYDMPGDGEVSVALLDQNGRYVRYLVNQQQRKKGTVVERWDGLDDVGKPLPAGTYTWKGIWHEPITTKYLLAVHNSGTPTYMTADGTGGWGADHGRPMTVCAAGDHMLLAWDGGEAGWSMLRTDLTGRRQWGIRQGAVHLATDGTNIYASGGGGFHDGAGIEIFDFKDGRPINFGRGTPKAEAPAGEGNNAVTGLAYRDGTLYASFGRRNLVALYDARQGTVKKTWDVPAPGRLAARADGSALVISGNQVLAVSPDGKASPLIADQLDAPSSIALDSQGGIYVANCAKLQNVSVFSADGKYQRSIGKTGGRPARGKFDKQGMFQPGGIDVDKQGKLWVAEILDSPKRISVWDTKTGDCVNEFFGASQYATWVGMDPKHDDEVFCHMTVWKVDLDKLTWRPDSTMWRAVKPNEIQAAYSDVRVITAKNGKQYAWGKWNYSFILYMREGDVFKPIASGIDVVKDNVYVQWPPYPMFDDNQKYPNGAYAWQDKNNDQTIQEDEIVKSPIGRAEVVFNWVDADLNLWSDWGWVTRPVRFEKDGRPVYDFSRPERIPVRGNNGHGGLWVDPQDGSFYTNSPDEDPGLARWTPDGKLIWGFRVTGSWNTTLNKPMPKPGQVWGATAPLGVAGDFTGVATYFGPLHLFTRDGMYVAKLFKDGRLGQLGPDVINCEAFAGQLVKLEKSGRYILLVGDTDGRVTEVLGLDTVKPMKGGSYQLTPEDAKAVADAQAEYARLKAQAQRLTIARGRPALDVAAPVTVIVDDKRNFTAKAAYDADNLYLAYDVQGANELVNSIPDNRIVFKGGNLLDLQLATDPKSDANRTTPVPGDVRVLISRRDGKPFAIVFRYKVAGFKGEPNVLSSPTGKESIDQIEVWDDVALTYDKTAGGFRAIAAIPLAKLGWKPISGTTVKMDLGYLFGNETGNQIGTRAYWSNHSFTASVTGDIPHESRIEPKEWGTAMVE